MKNKNISWNYLYIYVYRINTILFMYFVKNAKPEFIIIPVYTCITVEIFYDFKPYWKAA